MLLESGFRESIIRSARAAAVASATSAAVPGETSGLSTPVLERRLPAAAESAGGYTRERIEPISRPDPRGDLERGDLSRGVGGVAALPMALTLLTLPMLLLVLAVLLLGRNAGESGLRRGAIRRAETGGTRPHLLMDESTESRLDVPSSSRWSSASSSVGAMKGEEERGLGATRSSGCSARMLPRAPEAERFLTVLMASDVAVRWRYEGSERSDGVGGRRSVPLRPGKPRGASLTAGASGAAPALPLCTWLTKLSPGGLRA